MSEKFVTLAAFRMPIEAELARGRLEAEGIKAFLTGGGSVDVFGGVQGVGGLIDLQVAESDAERAADILTVYGDNHDDDAPPADDEALWLCPLCGDAVHDDLSVCPSCETPRPAPKPSSAVTAVPRHNPASHNVREEPAPRPNNITSDTPVAALPTAADDDLEVPDMETLVGDDLVRRAFLSALFGLAPYSFWLLGRIAFYPGKISPRMMPRLYWTIAIDGALFLVLLLGGLRLLILLFLRHPF